MTIVSQSRYCNRCSIDLNAQLGEDGLKGDVDPQVEELSRSVSMETSLNPGLGMLVGNSAGFPALTFILKADARNRFTAFRDSWNELLTGRPTYELGLEILEALLAQDALVYGLPSEWVMPVEELTDASSAVRFCIAEDFAFRGVAAYTAAAKAANARSDALQHPKNVYKQEQARKEEEKAEQLQFRMVNCATGEGQPGSFQELISSQLSVSGFGYDPGDTFMSLLELHASEEGLGRFHFRIPGYLKPACSSSNKRLVSRHEFDVSSAITPSGAFTAPHADYLGAHVPIYHIQGVKLWLLWPGTPSNIRYMSAWVAGRTPAFGSKFTIQCIKKLEGLITWIATDTGAIVLPPFTYHAVLTIGTGIHSGGPVYSYGHALSAFQALEIIVKEAQSTHKPSEYQMLHHELDENLECWSCCIQASHGRTPSVLPLLKGEKRTEEQLKIAEAWRASKAMVEAMKKVFAST